LVSPYRVLLLCVHNDHEADRRTFWNFVLRFMFNPNAGSLQGKVAFVFGATSLLTRVYTFYFRGRSFQDIDELFHKRIPTRNYALFVT
jgi:hypothetical protein